MERVLEATAAAEETHFWFHGLRRHARYVLSRALAGPPPRLILDCGAGTGRNLDWLATLGPAIGLEQSPAGLAFGRARGRLMVRGSVTHLPFPDGCADVVTSFDVLYCLNDLEERQALREMYRVLAWQGVALINVAALSMLRGAQTVLTGEVRRYTRRRLADTLEAAGFAIERITYTNCATFPLTLAVRLAEQATGRRDTDRAAYLTVPPAPVNALLDLALRAEHAWLRVANLPIGSSVLAVARKARTGA